MMWWLRFTLWHLRWICGIKVEVVTQFAGNLPTPAVIIARHQSTWETWFLQLYFAPLATILKRELLFIPFFGWGLALFHPITIDRASRMQAVRQVREQGLCQLGAGKNVLVFPEGTRVPVGQRRPFARSGIDLAAAAGVPIIPVTHNAGNCWPSRSFLKYPGTITVTIGKPIDTTQCNSKVLIQQVQAWALAEGAQPSHEGISATTSAA